MWCSHVLSRACEGNHSRLASLENGSGHDNIPLFHCIVPFNSSSMADLKFITPFLDKLDHCLSIGQAPSQGLVFALDTDIVIKLPFQYTILDDLDDNAIFYLNHGLRSFVATGRELIVYDAVTSRPHTNIARRLEVDSTLCLFLEWLQPLEEI